MRWVLSPTAAFVTGGLLTTVAVYGWYGSLDPCQIFKSDYLERKKIEIEQAGNPRNNHPDTHQTNHVPGFIKQHHP